MVLQLQATASFSSLKYLPGQMNIADALSRRTIIEETRTRNVAEDGVHQIWQT